MLFETQLPYKFRDTVINISELISMCRVLQKELCNFESLCKLTQCFELS
jgi:hypothetical protein